MDTPMMNELVLAPTLPRPILLVAALLSPLAGYAALSEGWPLWLVGLLVLAPWFPFFTWQTAWTYRNYGWFALFYVLVVTQTGHVLEHVAQMTQLHILGMDGGHSHGIFGSLDIEWVHFIWNSWVIIAVALLLYRFRSNPWLWVALAIAGWHQIEHSYMMWTYFSTGKEGTPGLLSLGGSLWGGLPLKRPDLHFIYNLIETLPIYVAFIYQWRRITAGEKPALSVRASSTPDQS